MAQFGKAPGWGLERRRFESDYSDWSECNYRTWKNPAISIVCKQQARGFIFLSILHWSITFVRKR